MQLVSGGFDKERHGCVDICWTLPVCASTLTVTMLMWLEGYRHPFPFWRHTGWILKVRLLTKSMKDAASCVMNAQERETENAWNKSGAGWNIHQYICCFGRNTDSSNRLVVKCEWTEEGVTFLYADARCGQIEWKKWTFFLVIKYFSTVNTPLLHSRILAVGSPSALMKVRAGVRRTAALPPDVCFRWCFSLPNWKLQMEGQRTDENGSHTITLRSVVFVGLQ